MLSANSSLSRCEAATLTPNAAPPQAPGPTIISTSTSNSCAGALFQFWLLPPGGTWTVKQPFSATNTWSWNTSGQRLGTYQVGVWAKAPASASRSYDAYYIGTYRLDIGTCTSGTISASPASPQTAGTPVTVTATANDCTSPRYEFWELPPPGVTWHIVGAYGTGNTFAWSTAGKKGP